MSSPADRNRKTPRPCRGVFVCLRLSHDVSAGGGVSIGPLLLKCIPVALRELGRPELDGAEPLVVVAVRGLLNLGIVPGVAAVVGPGEHLVLGQKVILVRRAAQRAVDDGAGLRPRYRRIGPESPVLVAVYEPQLRGSLDELGIPGAVRYVAEGIGRGPADVFEEADGDLGELSPCDAGVGPEAAVLISV